MARKQVKYHPSLFYGQDDIQCYICDRYGTPFNRITRHEIFFGDAYRWKSKKYGLWVNLCEECHNEVHNGKSHEKDERLKREGQRRFEEFYSRQKFMYEFGKNRLEDE